ncbi:MAG: hypothetical protein AAF587_08050 [Bacteroidota bacterium]
MIRLFSLIATVVHTASILMYVGSSATMTPAKYIGLGAVVLFMLVVIGVSARDWTDKIERIQETIEEFGENEAEVF